MGETRVDLLGLTLTNPLSPLLDAGYLAEPIRHHFKPLPDPAFESRGS